MYEYRSSKYWNTSPSLYYPYYQASIPQTNYYSGVRNQYPTVNTKQLTASASNFQKLMKDADKVIDEFANSNDFSYQVMEAAQKSDKDKVEKLIKGTGIKHPVNIQFNPDGIRLTFLAKTEQVDCCKLEMALHW